MKRTVNWLTLRSHGLLKIQGDEQKKRLNTKATTGTKEKRFFFAL